MRFIMSSWNLNRKTMPQ